LYSAVSIPSILGRLVRACCSISPAAPIRRLHRDERGVVAVIFAVVLIPLMALLAITVDVGYAYGQRRLAQNVADSGAIAGAKVIGERLSGATRTDANVLTAIRDAARNSSGGFFTTSTDYFTSVYVGGSYDANGNGVVQELSTPVTVGAAPGGTIPSSARGVRLVPRKPNPTFFAPVLGTNSLYAGARATALALDVVGFGAWAPYAIWAGELANRCFNTPYTPESGYKTRVDSNGQTQFVYGCVELYGGTDLTPKVPNGNPMSGSLTTSWGTIDPGCTNCGIAPRCWVPPGTYPSPPTNGCQRTKIAYYSPGYKTKNVINGDNPDPSLTVGSTTFAGGVTRWNVSQAGFKGYFRTTNQWVDVNSNITFDTQNGYSLGTSDQSFLTSCWSQNLAQPDSCLLILPVVRYADQPSSSSSLSLNVAGFLPIRMLSDPSGSGNDLYGEITIAVLTEERDVKTGPCPNNSPLPCLKVIRLVE